MAKKLTQEEYINRCMLKFGDKFDYSKVEYKNAKERITIGCKIHGWFSAIPWRHYVNKTGCFKCGHVDIGNKKKQTTEDFIRRAIEVHKNRYVYSNTKYIGMDNKVEIICRIHGSFFQRAAGHLWGNGCLKCRNLYTRDEFIEKCNKIHLNKYNYDNVIYIHNKKIIHIGCPIHGEFAQKATNHLQGNGCPKCNDSKGEREIRRWLDAHRIPYESQKTFEDCVNPDTGYCLKFDFYLTSKNILIEYDGQQHYFLTPEWTNETEEEFNRRRMRDMIKTEYANKNNIKLIRIKYSKWRTISKILLKSI